MKYDKTTYYVPDNEALENSGFKKFSNEKSIGNIIESSNEVYFSCYVQPFSRVLDFAANSIVSIEFVNLHYTEIIPFSKYNVTSDFDQDFTFLVRFYSKEEFTVFLWQIEMIDSSYFIDKKIYSQIANHLNVSIDRNIVSEFGFHQFEDSNTYYLLKSNAYCEIYHEIEFLDKNWILFSSTIESLAHIIDDENIATSMTEYSSALFDPYNNSPLSYPGGIEFERKNFLKIFNGKIALRLQSESALRLLIWQLRIID